MKVNSMDASIVKIGMANELKGRNVAAKESEFNMPKTEHVNRNALRLTEFEKENCLWVKEL